MLPPAAGNGRTSSDIETRTYRGSQRRAAEPPEDKMSSDSVQPEGPDFRHGVELSSIADGAMLSGRIDDEPVAACPPWRDTVRGRSQMHPLWRAARRRRGCRRDDPLPVAPRLLQPEHRRGAARAGAAIRCRAGASSGSDGIVYVREKIERDAARRPSRPAEHARNPIVIVGGGAAGNAAAETLRSEGYAGPHHDAERRRSAALRPAQPVQGLPGRQGARGMDPRCGPPTSTREHAIDVRLNARVARDRHRRKRSRTRGRQPSSYDALLLATGAEPVRLDVPGADLAARALSAHARRQPRARSPRRERPAARWSSARASSASRSRRRCARAASTCMSSRRRPSRWRACSAPSSAPSFARSTRSMASCSISARPPASIDEHGVTLRRRRDASPPTWSSSASACGPRLALAEQAGLTIDRGVLVDEYLETSAPGIFAAGDIARWPDPHSGERIRVEHWVVAERQGQTAARNMLGRREALRRRPVLLERALRRRDRLRRPCREMGRDPDRRVDRRSRLHDHLSARWPKAGGCGDAPRS